MKAISENYKPMSPLEWRNFSNRFEVSHNECWLWTSYKSDGYGSFFFRGKYVRAHRLCYTTLRGEINSDLHIDHLCRNRACVNPLHMEAVTHAINIYRGEGVAGVNKRKTVCNNGHLLQGENLVKDGFRRRCKTCKNMKERINSKKRACHKPHSRSIYI